MSHERDFLFMTRALALAARPYLNPHPNPRVGCVLVQGEDIIAEGWHQAAGQAHAEAHALAVAGARARGATAYVTLEPCSHHGRTPPCADALIAAGVSRVVVAMSDPNPRVAGQGLARLSAAGVKVECGLLEAQARALNPGFLQRMEQRRPLVRSKLAMSLDARTALANGESQWITGVEARQDVQRLRAQAAAIVTGIGSVLADDPRLNVRDPSLGVTDARQPVRVVLDSQLQMPGTARMLGMPGQTWVATLSDLAAAPLQAAGAQVMVLPAAQGRVSLPHLLQELARREINDVLVEAGPCLNGALLQAGLIDELIIYLAPHVLGSKARGLFDLPGLEHMQQRMNVQIQDIRAVGADWRITASPIGARS